MQERKTILTVQLSKNGQKSTYNSSICHRQNETVVLQAQAAHAQAAPQPIAYQQAQAPPPYSVTPAYASSALYPSLTEYMGLEITPEMVSRHAVVPVSSRQVCDVSCK